MRHFQTSRFRSPFSFFNLFLFLIALSGCVATTTDVDRLQDSLKSMQKNQADLVVKMEELDQSLVKLREKLDESQKKMASLTQKLDDTQSRLGNRMELISQLLSAATTHAAVPIPSVLYREADSDYRSDKIELAISGFKNFLQRYPESDLADDAQFRLADCYFIKKDFIRALDEFTKVSGNSAEYRPSALLKRSYALGELNQPNDQKETLKVIIKESPYSQEAQTAKQLLDSLEPPPPPEPPKVEEKPVEKEKKPSKKER